MTDSYRTNRWRGIVAVALATLGIGLVATEPAIVALAAVCVGFAVYPHVLSAPDAIDVELERSVTPADPVADQPVRVHLSVENTGSRIIPDLRIVDGVPHLATVTDGTPRAATALRPGESATISYQVSVPAGKHRFSETSLVVRNAAGSIERTATADCPTVIDCDDRDISVPVTTFVTHRPGPIPTDRPGAGVEFYGTREASPDEAIDRIDWRRFARTGELVSVEFRPERSANVVVCVDTADPRDGDLHVGGAPDLAMRCRTVADRVIDAVGADNHAVGLAVTGPAEVWIPPGMGGNHVDRIRTTLETHRRFRPPISPTETDGPRRNGTGAAIECVMGDGPSDDEEGPSPTAIIEERVGPNDQVIIVSPLLTDSALDTALSLGTPPERVTIISPAPRSRDGLGSRLANLGRMNRIRALRSQGIRVFEWEADEPLRIAAEQWMEGDR